MHGVMACMRAGLIVVCACFMGVHETRGQTIACGLQHTCAVMMNGRVRCWGKNSDGNLGYGNTQDIGGNYQQVSEVAV